MGSLRPAIAAAALATLVAVVMLLPSQATARAPARVPQGFVGTVLDGPMFPVASGIDLGNQLTTMAGSGVESLRVEFDWATTQPYAHWSNVPAADRSRFTDVDGLPLDLSALDQLVGLAADRGISVRPEVTDAPSWDAVPQSGFHYVSTPRLDTPYATFLKALVDRYGPHGSFWAGRAHRVPIRSWEVWNEPNFTVFWFKPNWERSYAQLLKVGHDAIRRADRGAQVVLAGLANSSWEELADLYRVHGIGKLFDAVAIHPYTRYPQGVITILRYVRQAMNKGGDRRKPIVADEVGWNSSLGQSPQHLGGFETTEAVQAKNISTVMGLLAKYRSSLNLMGFDIYDWASSEARGEPEFFFAGLFKAAGGKLTAKPSYRAFRDEALKLERCRVKSSATHCAKSA